MDSVYYVFDERIDDDIIEELSKRERDVEFECYNDLISFPVTTRNTLNNIIKVGLY